MYIGTPHQYTLARAPATARYHRRRRRDHIIFR
jgi:hypothetical protein